MLFFNYSPLSYSIDLEKMKEEIVAEKARTALLEEEIKVRDRSIAEATTSNETLNKRIEGNMS